MFRRFAPNRTCFATPHHQIKVLSLNITVIDDYPNGQVGDYSIFMEPHGVHCRLWIVTPNALLIAKHRGSIAQLQGWCTLIAGACKLYGWERKKHSHII